METLYYNVSSQISSRHRKIFRIMKMCTMCFIHNKRNLMSVYNFCNCLYIRHNAVICRRSKQKSLHIRIFFQISFHTFRGNSSVYPQSLIFMWINIDRLKLT